MDVLRYKNTNTKGKSIYQERVGHLISKSVFDFKLCHLTFQEYCIEFMFHLFIEKDFKLKGGRKRKRKRKTKTKRESVKLWYAWKMLKMEYFVAIPNGFAQVQIILTDYTPLFTSIYIYIYIYAHMHLSKAREHTGQNVVVWFL